MTAPVLLTFNAGSSSLRFSAWSTGGSGTPLLNGTIEAVGQSRSSLTLTVGELSEVFPVAADDHCVAARAGLDEILTRIPAGSIHHVAHRLVHGGTSFRRATLIDGQVRQELQVLSTLAPQHMPAALQIVDLCVTRLPDAHQIACFDTAFHRNMPIESRLLALPLRFFRSGIERFGFHGLSYAHVVWELRRSRPDLASGRLIVAHLGSGCSLAAIRDGRSVETTMGFTPAGGVPMATRPGDLDPGLLLHLIRQEGLTVDSLEATIQRGSGLLGMSETSSDVRDLLSAEGGDRRAADALAMFTQRIRQQIGAFAATLGGVDALVFTGGIGEHSAEIRRRICEGLGFLGIGLDESRNLMHAGDITSEGRPVQVLVVRTAEEAQIRREAMNLIATLPRKLEER